MGGDSEQLSLCILLFPWPGVVDPLDLGSKALRVSALSRMKLKIEMIGRIIHFKFYKKHRP